MADSQAPQNVPLTREGETVYVYGPNDIAYQRDCDGGCDKGLLTNPARFCGRCGGSGFLTRWEHPDAD